MTQATNNQNCPRAWHDGIDAALEVIRGPNVRAKLPDTAARSNDDAALRLRPVRRDYAPDLPIVQAPRAWARAVAKLEAAAD
jgi:hypothetical protein